MKLPLRLFLVFLLFFSVLLLIHLQKQGFWSIDDPYYHVKHSLLMLQSHNFVLVRPWLEFHFLNYAPNDPWWGFHLLMAGFIYLFGTFLGAKIFSASLSSLVLVGFYFILNRFEVKRPFVWTLLLFISSSFFEYRLFLERPFILALIILPLACYLMYKQRYISLLFLSVLYALLYHFFLTIIMMALFYLAVDFYQNRKVGLKPLLATTLGSLIGVILHPASMNYFFVVTVHFWEVLYLKFSGVNLGVGNEIQMSSIFVFISNNFIVLAVFLIALALFLSNKKYQQDFLILFFFLISTFWFLVSLILPRGIDFWLPFAWLFIAILFNKFNQSVEYGQIKDFIAKKVNLRIVSIYLMAGLAIIVCYNLLQIYNYVQTSNNSKDKDSNYQQVGDYLIAHTAPGEVVFYNEWGMWPRMFFYDDYNHYITGMDPTFLYEYSHQLFWLWSNIASNGVACDQPDGCLKTPLREQQASIKTALREEFRTNYLVVANKPGTPLVKILDNRRQDFVKVLENDSLLVYKTR